MRQVRKSDIEWRNGTLISKFVNETGKLFNRY